MSKFTALWIGLIILSTQTALAKDVDNEKDLRSYLDQVTAGTITYDNCDKDPNYESGKYCLVQITKSFTLTAPVTLPPKIHMLGNSGDNTPVVITASYDVTNTGACIFNLNGFAALGQATVNVNTYRSDPSPKPMKPLSNTALCMTSDSNILHDITVESLPFTIPSGSLALNHINGVSISGNSNHIADSTITKLDGIGIDVFGEKNDIETNTLEDLTIGILVGTSFSNVIKNNTVSGNVAFGFGAAVPIGKAANWLLLNTITNTSAQLDQEDYSFQKVYGQTPDSLDKCDSDVFYDDNGKCSPFKMVYQAQPQFFEMANQLKFSIPIQAFQTGNQFQISTKLSAFTTMKLAKPDPAAIDTSADPNNQTLPKDVTPQVGIVPFGQMTPASPNGGAAGCSLIR